MNKLTETRRANLKRLLVSRYDNNQATLAKALDRPSSFVWRLLTAGRHARAIGEELARHIERQTGMRPYWLDGIDQVVQPEGVGNVSPSIVGRRRIPLLSLSQALSPSRAIETFSVGGIALELLTDMELGPHAFAVDVVGVSMEPDYHAGDRVIIDPAVFPSPGDHVLASVNGEAVLRKFRDRSLGSERAYELAPANDGWAMINSSSPGITVEIIGTVMEHRRYRKR